MIEREGFEAFCKSTNPKYKTTDDSVIDRAAWKIWREACAWQRKQDAALVEENSHMFFTAKACDSLAGAIREQAFLAALRVPNAPHEGPGAASSRTVPLDAVVGPRTARKVVLMVERLAHWLGWTALYHVAWTSGIKSGDMTLTVRPWITAANWKKAREVVAAENNYEPADIAIMSVTKL